MKKYTRFKGLLIAGLIAFLALSATPTARAADASPSTDSVSYRLHLYHLHTGERLNLVYRIGDQYLDGPIAELNHFLRDHRSGDVKDYDIREFDLLHDLLVKLGRPDREIDIVCGYRTPGATAISANVDPALR